MDIKAKVTATVRKIDFGCSHKEQIENRYPQWLKNAGVQCMEEVI